MKYYISEKSIKKSTLAPVCNVTQPSEGLVTQQATVKKRSKFSLRRWIAYIAILTFVVSGITYSRFISTTNGNDDARVAYFNVANSSSSQTITLLPGEESNEKYFSVILDSSKLEVAVVCNITVESNSGIAYSTKISSDNGINKDVFYDTATVNVHAGGMMNYLIYLVVPNSLGYEFAGMVDIIKITVDVIQID